MFYSSETTARLEAQIQISLSLPWLIPPRQERLHFVVEFRDQAWSAFSFPFHVIQLTSRKRKYSWECQKQYSNSWTELFSDNTGKHSDASSNQKPSCVPPTIIRIKMSASMAAIATSS
jgi:hypothetical protein